ncbi:MAG: cytochrome b [Candidatus Paceibacterota bacterium]
MSSLPSEYDRYTKAFHWVIALVIFTEYISVWLIPEGTRGPNFLISYHMSFGVLVIALMLARIVWRFYATIPAHPEGMPGWQVKASKWTHLTLYALIFIVPLTGWLWISARGWHATIFGIIQLPPLVSAQPAFASFLGNSHEAMGTLLLVIVGFHALAAFYHWIIVKDRVMQQMWP